MKKGFDPFAQNSNFFNHFEKQQKGIFKLFKLIKWLAIIQVVALIFVFATHDFSPTLTIDGITYGDYGLLNQDDMKNDKILYEPNWPNIFIGAVFADFIVPPVYVFGYHFMKPVGIKLDGKVKGQVN